MSRGRRQREPLSRHWERQQQARAAWSWGRIKWDEQICFWKRLRQLPSALSGAGLKAAAGVARLQNSWHGVVIASGAKIAEASGIAESTWWNYVLDELIDVGFLQIQERGGGVLKGSPRTGHAHVYAVAGAVMQGPDGLVIVPQPRRRQPPRSPAPPGGAAEAPVTAPAPALTGPAPLARATGPP